MSIVLDDLTVRLDTCLLYTSVVLVKPERFENASEIADHLKEKRTVVINLESTNKDIARRLIDFLSGDVYKRQR